MIIVIMNHNKNDTDNSMCNDLSTILSIWVSHGWNSGDPCSRPRSAEAADSFLKTLHFGYTPFPQTKTEHPWISRHLINPWWCETIQNSTKVLFWCIYIYNCHIQILFHQNLATTTKNLWFIDLQLTPKRQKLYPKVMTAPHFPAWDGCQVNPGVINHVGSGVDPQLQKSDPHLFKCLTTG